MYWPRAILPLMSSPKTHGKRFKKTNHGGDEKKNKEDNERYLLTPWRFRWNKKARCYLCKKCKKRQPERDYVYQKGSDGWFRRHANPNYDPLACRCDDPTWVYVSCA